MPTIVHFDIASDNPARAKQFYEGVFDWKMTSPPGMTDYYLIETKDLNEENGVRGGLGQRGEPGQRITAYIGVNSIEEYVSRVEKLGGKIVQPKMSVPGFGHLAICMDTEDNMFGLWQDDENVE